MTTPHFTSLRDALRAHSCGELATWAEVSKRTAESWRAGYSKPSAPSLLALLRRSPAIRRALLGDPP